MTEADRSFGLAASLSRSRFWKLRKGRVQVCVGLTMAFDTRKTPVQAELGVGFPGDGNKTQLTVDECDMKEKQIGPSDFTLLRVVGQGAFRKVFLVQHIRTKEIFAMKVMKKEEVMEKNQGDCMKAERDILMKVVHPLIVQFRYSFQLLQKDPYVAPNT